MPTAELLDFAALTAPIPGDTPAGGSLDYDLRRKLDEYRTEFDPGQYGEGSPEREQKKREANWGGIIEQTKSALTRKSKHIIYAARLVEALGMVHGFAGVRDGMKFMRLLCTECWDRMVPPIEEAGDESARIAQINWLGDPTSGAYFPTKIRKMALFSSGGEPLSWQRWKDGEGNFESAADAASPEHCQLLVDDLTAAIEEVRQLQQAAEAKAPSDPPELGETSRALGDCLNLAKQAQARKGGDEGAAVMTGEGAAPGAAVVVGAASPANTAATRQGIYNQIQQLAGTLEKLEPHSPVPMLLRKAILLGPLRFHELVEVLTRDSRVIDFIKVEEENG